MNDKNHLRLIWDRGKYASTALGRDLNIGFNFLHKVHFSWIAPVCQIYIFGHTWFNTASWHLSRNFDFLQNIDLVIFDYCRLKILYSVFSMVFCWYRLPDAGKISVYLAGIWIYDQTWDWTLFRFLLFFFWFLPIFFSFLPENLSVLGRSLNIWETWDWAIRIKTKGHL